jgi:hypothetical protein
MAWTARRLYSSLLQYAVRSNAERTEKSFSRIWFSDSETLRELMVFGLGDSSYYFSSKLPSQMKMESSDQKDAGAQVGDDSAEGRYGTRLATGLMVLACS